MKAYILKPQCGVRIAMLLILFTATHPLLTRGQNSEGEQKSPPRGQEPSNDKQQKSGEFLPIERGSEVIGGKIVNRKREKMATVKELILDLRESRVVYVVFPYGGVLGLGNRLLAPPGSILKPSEDGQSLILNMDKLSLGREAPSLKSKKWEELYEREWRDKTYEFYKESRYWDRGQVRTSNASSGATGNESEESGQRSDVPKVSTKPLHWFTKATKVLGMKVKSSNGKMLGKVHDLALDWKEGRVRYVVVKSGSVLGLGGKQFAVPLATFTISAKRRFLLWNVSAEQVEQLKEIDPDAWPEQAPQKAGNGEDQDNDK